MPRHKKHPQPLPPGENIVDTLEGSLARVELPDGTTRDIPLSQLPEDAKEGDVLHVTPETIAIDPIETAKRQASAQTQLDALNAQAPGGDIEL